MILNHIIIAILILFFAIRLVSAIREAKKKEDKITLMSKKTGQILEIDTAQIADFINTEFIIFPYYYHSLCLRLCTFIYILSICLTNKVI